MKQLIMHMECHILIMRGICISQRKCILGDYDANAKKPEPANKVCNVLSGASTLYDLNDLSIILCFIIMDASINKHVCNLFLACKQFARSIMSMNTSPFMIPKK